MENAKWITSVAGIVALHSGTVLRNASVLITLARSAAHTVCYLVFLAFFLYLFPCPQYAKRLYSSTIPARDFVPPCMRKSTSLARYARVFFDYFAAQRGCERAAGRADKWG